jgi:hypothetical protein
MLTDVKFHPIIAQWFKSRLGASPHSSEVNNFYREKTGRHPGR